MKILQYLIPKFLKKIDHYLLLRYPVLWETRVHFVVFYSLILGNVLALGLGMIYPVSKANIPDFEQVLKAIFFMGISCHFWSWDIMPINRASNAERFIHYRKSYCVQASTLLQSYLFWEMPCFFLI